MWESGGLLADFQARRKGWETRSLSFPCFPTGWHFHRARWVLSERSDAGYSLPPRFLRIDLPRISIRWALCTSRPRMLSRASDADLLTLTWPPGVGWSRLSSAPAKQRRLAQNIYAGHSTMVSVFGPGTRGVGIGMLVPRCLSHWHSCRCSILSRPPVDSCKRDVRI